GGPGPGGRDRLVEALAGRRERGPPPADPRGAGRGGRGGSEGDRAPGRVGEAQGESREGCLPASRPAEHAEDPAGRDPQRYVAQHEVALVRERHAVEVDGDGTPRDRRAAPLAQTRLRVEELVDATEARHRALDLLQLAAQ